eukprot:gene12167-13422_t
MASSSSQLLARNQSNCKVNYENRKRGEIDFGQLQLNGNNNGSCIWMIEMQAGHKIALSVINLSLQVGDSLSITDHNMNETKIIQNRVFISIPHGTVLYSESEVMKIELRYADANRVSFNAVFEESTCGGELTLASDMIEVPLFAHFSSSPVTCKWTIKAMEQKRVKVSFLQFYLPAGSCISDNLIIKEGGMNSEQLLGDFCEETPPMGNIVTSMSSIATIEYTRRPGFAHLTAQELMTSERPKIKMHYEFFDPCMSKMTGMFGSIVASDAAYYNYQKNNCIWDIEVPHSYYVSLTFLKYSKSNEMQERSKQIMNIYDGIAAENRSLIWSSENSMLPPTNLIATSNQIRIELKTNDVDTPSRIHFNAVYQAHVVDAPLVYDECINVGNRRFFQCTNGHYIDCDWKCDGEADCDDGIDELFCRNDASSYALEQARVRPLTEIEGAVMIFIVAGSAILACVLVLSLDQLLRNRDYGVVSRFSSEDGHVKSFVTSQLPSLPPYSTDDPNSTISPPSYQQVKAMEHALLQYINDSKTSDKQQMTENQILAGENNSLKKEEVENH